ncbi:MAG: TIGR02452 family protein [Chloroflexia bacterium]|nr:TIGR02452 family protein [Chloroflexia bacterium]
MRRTLSLNLPVLAQDEFLMELNAAKMVGQATQQIILRGSYLTELGQEHDISAALAHASAQRITYMPDTQIPISKAKYSQAVTYVHNQTALTVAHARQKRGYRVAILNFTNPLDHGGGWLQGVQSQEASLARSSGLMHCLANHPWYHQRSHQFNPFYDDTVIVVPHVPVFRSHEGDLLEVPVHHTIISTAAVHANDVRLYMPHRAAEIPLQMARRATRVIEAAAKANANVLILGAWGAGEFGHTPALIATAFQVALESLATRAFAIIDFAVPDIAPNTPVYSHFHHRFHEQSV